jgi:hypothetical protein
VQPTPVTYEVWILRPPSWSGPYVYAPPADAKAKQKSGHFLEAIVTIEAKRETNIPEDRDIRLSCSIKAPDGPSAFRDVVVWPEVWDRKAIGEVFAAQIPEIRDAQLPAMILDPLLQSLSPHASMYLMAPEPFSWRSPYVSIPAGGAVITLLFLALLAAREKRLAKQRAR